MAATFPNLETMGGDCNVCGWPVGDHALSAAQRCQNVRLGKLDVVANTARANSSIRPRPH